MLENPASEKVTTAALAAKARRVRGGALSPLHGQGADMQRPDRVSSEADAVRASSTRSPVKRRAATRQIEAIVGVLLGFAQKNRGMTRVLIGDAGYPPENERLQARINQFHDRVEGGIEAESYATFSASRKKEISPKDDSTPAACANLGPRPTSSPDAGTSSRRAVSSATRCNGTNNGRRCSPRKHAGLRRRFYELTTSNSPKY